MRSVQVQPGCECESVEGYVGAGLCRGLRLLR